LAKAGLLGGFGMTNQPLTSRTRGRPLWPLSRNRAAPFSLRAARSRGGQHGQSRHSAAEPRPEAPKSCDFLREIFRAISPTSVLITIHLKGQFDSQLGKVLSATRPLTARFATDGEPMQKSRIYIALPERHPILDSDLLCGPRENSARPALPRSGPLPHSDSRGDASPAEGGERRHSIRC